MRSWTRWIAAAAWLLAVEADAGALEQHVESLQTKGREPQAFVLDLLTHYDLLLFDDALHTAVEPFEFYQELVESEAFLDRVDFLFLETVPLNKQRHLDAYLTSDSEDPSLLYPAFQDDLGGTGFGLQTYFDLLATVRRVNLQRDPVERLEVVAVSNPTYWSEIVTRDDVQRFRDGLLGRDYHMYRYILAKLENFDGSTGVFLTNTRHAYTNIRKSSNDLYWNCGTFFRQHHPGRTYSVRFHNVTLFIEKRAAVDARIASTSQGLEKADYRWARMEDGLWDTAFAEYGRPVAFSLANTPFGSASYVGNHMLDVAPGQTMTDAYDGVIYLKPLESLRQSVATAAIYTDEFRSELARRYTLLHTEEQLANALEKEGVDRVEDLVARVFTGRPERPVPQVGPMDAWRRRP